MTDVGSRLWAARLLSTGGLALILLPLVGLIAPACLDGDAQAAEISLASNTRTPLVTIEGKIEAGDDVKFKQLTEKLGYATVLLYADGGQTQPAIEIGKIITEKRFGTAVADGFDCSSACGLVWLAGSPRFLARKGRVGFPGSYSASNGAPISAGDADGEVGRYLAMINLSERAKGFVAPVGPRAVNWLALDRASETGIEVTALNEGGPTKGEAKIAAAPAAPASPPVASASLVAPNPAASATVPPALPTSVLPAAAATPAVAATAKLPVGDTLFGTVASWEIRRGDASVGNGCYALTSYAPDLVLIVGFDLANKSIYMNVGSARLQPVDPAKAYAMQVRFDNHKPWDARAEVGYSNKIKFMMMSFRAGEFMDQFMNANGMTLREPGKDDDKDVLRLNLPRSGAAAREMLRCQGGANPLGVSGEVASAKATSTTKTHETSSTSNR